MRKRANLERGIKTIYTKYFSKSDLSKEERLNTFKSQINDIYNDTNFEDIDRRYQKVKYIQKYGSGMKSILISFAFGGIATYTINYINNTPKVNLSDLGLLALSVGIIILFLIGTILFFVMPPKWFVKSMMNDAETYLYPYEVEIIEKLLKGETDCVN